MPTYRELKIKESGGLVSVGDPRTLTKADSNSPTFTGVPAAPTAEVNTNTAQVATTAFVLAQAGTAAPIVEGVATVGSSTLFARQDHVHPSSGGGSSSSSGFEAVFLLMGA